MTGTSDVRGTARIWYPPNLVMEERTILAEDVRCYNMDLVTVRRGATVSQGAYICAGTHDIDDPGLRLITKPIDIGPEAWIASDAFVGPGVTIGEGAVLGARAVTVRDVEEWSVYVGNPARKIRNRTPILPPEQEISR